MATGREMKLTGATGEFLVAAELCRRGLMATPFAGNVPHYDIIASGQAGGHLAVQVKTVTKGSWQFTVTQFVEIRFDGQRQIVGARKEEPYPGLWMVLVALAAEGDSSDHFYVLTWDELRDLLVERHRAYLGKHGGVRPRSPKSTHVSLPQEALAPFRNRWQILSGKL